MNRYLLVICIGLLVLPGMLFADDLTFDSFAAAEAAAQKRAQEYQKKMDEHIQTINKEWEESQRDLGSDSSYPDVTKITSRSDGQKSSDNDASKSMENAVNSSVNNLKDQMINSAGPNSTGFAGGGAGYQWSVKFVNGKYVLSDSYNEAEFNTGKGKKSSDPSPSEVATKPDSGSGSDKADTVADKPSDSDPGTDKTAASPAKGSSPGSTAAAPAGAPGSSTGTSPSGSPATSGPSSTDDCPDGVCEVPTDLTAPAKDPAKPPTPGLDAAPPSLPPPAVKLVIQHPTDFSEEVFSSNADSETPENYDLDRFTIPEDTRIKIAIELSDDVNPDDVSLVITDDEGTGEPVSSGRLRNYRHMFRIPDDSKYSASVYINDKSRPGNYKKKLMQVKIPVTKVDFESRAIDNQRGTRSGNSGSSKTTGQSGISSSSAAGSTSSNANNYSGTRQVDLSDFYSSGDSGDSGESSSDSSGASDSSAGSSYSGESGYSGSAGHSQGRESSGYSADSTGGYDSGYGSNTQHGDSSGTAGSTSNTTGSHASHSGSRINQHSSGSTQALSGTSQNQTSSSANSGWSSSATGSGEYGNDSNEGEIYYSSNSSGQQGQGQYSSTGEHGQNSSGGNRSDGNSYGHSSDESSGNYEGDEGSYAHGQNGSFKIASARDLNVQDSDPSNPENSSNVDLTENESIEISSDDPFVIALSLKSEKHKLYQSFDFIDQPTQISSAIPAGNEIIFSINYSKLVDPDSISIILSDGRQKIDGNLKSMGESFAYIFPEPNADSYIHLTGKAAGKIFNYRLSMPVSRK